MPVNKHALIRYHALDKCFSNFARRYYIEDLIEACNEALYNFTGDERYGDPLSPGISRRQVFVDIAFMESSEGWSANVEHIKDGRRVYYRYEDSEFTINNQPITDEELTQLRETTLMLSRFKGLPQFEWIETMVANLEDKFNLKGAEQSVISLDRNEFVAGIEYISPLFNAIINKTPILIRYKTFKGDNYNWELHPYFLKQYNHRWYIIGMNHQYKNVTIGALDRIESVEDLHIPYEENTLIEDIEEYFEDIVGVSFPQSERNAESVKLKFSPERFPFVKAKPIHGSQKIRDEKEGIITLDVIPNFELESILLSHGDSVEVLEPQDLRNKISEKIKNTYEKYFPVQKDCTNKK